MSENHVVSGAMGTKKGTGILTDGRRADLVEHLRNLPDRQGDGPLFGDTDAVVETIERALAYSSAVKSIPAARRLAQRKAGERRMAAIVRNGRQLRELLRISPPMYRTAGLDWKQLDASLAVVVKAAAVEADGWKSLRSSGRPPLEWRDSLIAVVASLYPIDRKRTERKHMVGTIEMLLRFLTQREVEDLDGIIADALKRKAYREKSTVT